MSTNRSDTLSVLGRELGKFTLICVLAFGLLRLTQHFWDDALTMLAGSSAIVAIMLLVKRDLAVTVVGLLVGILGPLAEMRGVAVGAWTYARPNIEGVPAWLFLVWCAVGIIIACLYEFLRVLIAQTHSEARISDDP